MEIKASYFAAIFALIYFGVGVFIIYFFRKRYTGRFGGQGYKFPAIIYFISIPIIVAIGTDFFSNYDGDAIYDLTPSLDLQFTIGIFIFAVIPTLVYLGVGIYILSLEHIKKKKGYKGPAIIYFISVPTLILIAITIHFMMNYTTGRFEATNKPAGYELYKFLVLKDIIPRSGKSLDEDKTTQTSKVAKTESTKIPKKKVEVAKVEEPKQEVTIKIVKQKIKLDLVFCTSDITKYQYSKYSDVYLKDFEGGCPSSKPIEISYKQFSELRSSNYKLCYIKNSEGLRIYYTPGPCDRSYMGGPKGVIINNDGKQFYYMGILDETQIAKKKPSQTQEVIYKTDEKYYALVIGNNNYEHLEKLDAAQYDAEVIADILENKYGFEVDLLLNADYETTVDTLYDVTNKVKNNDNLLIYYAGHGELEKAENRGYWLPVDASYKQKSKWISNQRIVDRVKATKAKHVLLMVDSCFSGTLMRSGTAPEVKETMDEKYIERLKKKKTRLVITSGGNEPVVDSDGGQHSLFALKLIDILKNNNSVINSQMLFEPIRKYVSANADQTPAIGQIFKAGHDDGDFLFFAKN